MQNLPTRSEPTNDGHPFETIQLTTVWNEVDFELT